MKGNKKVNRKCKLDADKRNDYTARVATLFPLSEQSEITCVGIICCRQDQNKARDISAGC